MPEHASPQISELYGWFPAERCPRQCCLQKERRHNRTPSGEPGDGRPPLGVNRADLGMCLRFNSDAIDVYYFLH